MKRLKFLTVVPLALLLGCQSESSPSNSANAADASVGSSSGDPSNDASSGGGPSDPSGTPGNATPPDPNALAAAGIQLTKPSDAFVKWQAARQGSKDKIPSVTLPEGTFALGYVPSPVERPKGTRAQFHTQTTYPATYDLRTNGKLTAIRDQAQCGDCWAFASYSSAESVLKTGATWDFSEDHLNNAHGFDIPACNGGNSDMAAAYLARWSGAVSEADAPYTATAHSYSSQPTVRMHLEEAIWLPARANAADNDEIKSAVTNYGAVYVSMGWYNNYYRSQYASYYDPGPASNSNSVNHAVAIVGWDDSYAANKFPTNPPGPGAFIVRNNWGTGFGESGYFYISYHDVHVASEATVFTRFGSSSNYTNEYKYDRLGGTGGAYGGSSSTGYAAHLFTATSSEPLAAVSFFTNYPTTDYDVIVYDNPDHGPTSGTLVGHTAGTLTHAGYFTVSTSSIGYTLTSGRPFSVIVKLTGVGLSSLNYPLEYAINGYSTGISTAGGRAYFGYDGVSWMDLGSNNMNATIKAFTGTSSAPPSSCDDGNACTTDSLSGNTCVHTPKAGGTVCRASAGACDLAEVCAGDGSACPADTKKSSGTTCRSSTGACDAAEVCDGTTNACPSDRMATSGTVCRASTGDCDPAETCTGSSPTCPSNSLASAGTVCRAPVGDCDNAEVCNGTSAACPSDKKKAAGTVCRTKGGVCDVAETCNGTSGECPVDKVASSSVVCRPSAGVCDVADKCDGSSKDCVADTLKSDGSVCRASTGPCDPAEKCDGSTVACPANSLSSAGTVCRASAGACDVEDVCNGTTAACPNVLKPATETCRASEGDCDKAEMCTGKAAACPSDGKKASGTVCRAKAGTCDVAETCNGHDVACPEDHVAAATVVCRASAGVCDVAEKCDGSSKECASDAKKESGTVCRASAGACDVAETCDGSGNACPTNALASSGTVCRASAGACDVEDVCSGSSASCPNVFKPSTEVCRAAEGACDKAEKCSGTTAACPNDAVQPNTVVCRAAAGTCDVADKCNGSSKECTSDVLRPAGFVCLSSPRTTCDGTKASCL